MFKYKCRELLAKRWLIINFLKLCIIRNWYAAQISNSRACYMLAIAVYCKYIICLTIGKTLNGVPLNSKEHRGFYKNNNELCSVCP